MSAKAILTTVWLFWGVLILLAMVAFSTMPLFGNDVGKAWEWLIPRLLPMMTLVAGLQVATRQTNQPAGAAAPPAVSVWGALLFSVVYLGLLSFSILNALSSPAPLEGLKIIDLPLGAILTLLAPALGVLYARS